MVWVVIAYTIPIWIILALLQYGMSSISVGRGAVLITSNLQLDFEIELVYLSIAIILVSFEIAVWFFVLRKSSR